VPTAVDALHRRSEMVYKHFEISTEPGPRSRRILLTLRQRFGPGTTLLKGGIAMKLRTIAIALGLLLVCCGAALAVEATMAGPNWSMNATIIEACSCPMFCQCYFDSKPAGHAMTMAGHEGMAEKYCRFNNVLRVNKGMYGTTKLDGAKFWIGGDLGDDFSAGQMDWAVIHFDPSVTKEQRAGIAEVMGHVYPVKWKSFTVGADGPIDWSYTKDRAVAKMDGGKMGEVILNRNTQSMTSAPIVIQNLKYWGVPRNTGFNLMQNEVEAYRVGDKAFEFKGTNGFMITFDINSKDMMAKPKG
jgi:hypothetical protein